MPTAPKPEEEAVPRTPPPDVDFSIEPRFRVFRYLFSDGYVLDVKSPYRADSNDRALVLAEADRKFGKDSTRKIEGVAGWPESE